MIANIAVEKTSIRFDQLFSYVVPEKFSSLTIGQLILVPFGSGNKLRQGIVFSFSEGEEEKLKQIHKVLSEEALLSQEQLEMVLWMKEHTFCTYFDAVRQMIPLGLMSKPARRFFLIENKSVEENTYTETEKLLLEKLSTKKKGLSEATLEKHIPDEIARNEAIEKFEKMGLLCVEDQYLRRVQDETVLFVEQTEREVPEGLKLSEKQRTLLQFLKENGAISLKELNYFAGISRSVADGLVKKGLVRYREEDAFRTPYSDYGNSSEEKDPVLLSDEQEEVSEGLAKLLHQEKPEAALLYGVTGSGKTEVFCKLMEENLFDGRQGILLVPEISLTPQAVHTFKSRFGEQVAVLHSRLSLGERLDEYKRMKNGEARIAIGTRSAIFSPFENLGLIIIDEEQESTYKSESAPRYHARDVARFRCGWHNGMLLLASATPSIESFYLAEKGRYHLFRLNHRYGNASLPDVTVVDLADSHCPGESNVLSGTLLDAQEHCLSRGEQSIFLLNRRGYQTIVTCAECGHVVECPHCSIALTYHQKNQRLMCHCCGFSEELKTACPHCGQNALAYRGLGTQKVEEQLREMFPEARILRMDMDTTLTKHAHEEKLEAFRNGEYDLMIGTQMVAKGLDFPNVTLVGVLLADQTLYAEDFRSAERGFSLLTQVVGRSGRGEKIGRAIIQTYTPYNPVLQLAAMQDYEGFYAEEITIRKLMLYPPFASFAVAGFSSTREHLTREAAETFLKLLRESLTRAGGKVPVRILGPTPSSLKRVAGKYRYKLVIKCIDNKNMRDCIRLALEAFSSSGIHRDVQIFIDMNYYGSL